MAFRRPSRRRVSYSLIRGKHVTELESRFLCTVTNNPTDTFYESGNHSSTTLTVGSTSGDYGLLYQTTGATTASTSANIGYVSGSRGSLVLKGGSFSLTSTANPLNIGSSSSYGEFANASGTVSVAGSTYIAGSGSFYSQNAGATTINGFVSIGSGGLLLVSGGSYQSNNVYSSGTLELGGSLTGSPTATVRASGLTLNGTATLKYDFADAGVPTLNLGTYSISEQTGANLVLDLSNYHVNSVRTFTLATYSNSDTTPIQRLVSALSLVGDASYVNYGVTLSYSGTSLSVTITPQSPSGQLIASGQLNSSSQVEYQYGPSLMYDETEGLYKIWFTAYPVGATGTSVGDNIVYKEYPTLAGLYSAPATYAFSKTDTSTTVDGYATADPDVYRDPATGGYFLAYTGNANLGGSQTGYDSEIGMAGSADGGRWFTAYNVNSPNGELVNYSTTPNSYGVGQPAVVYAHGYWWMFLTNQEGTPTDPSGGADISNMIDCIKSPNANFTSDVTFVNAWNYGGYGPSNTGLSNSVGAVYDPTTDQILLVSNGTRATNKSPDNIGYDNINITPFNWNATNSTFAISSTFTQLTLTNEPYSFGEGLGVLSSSDGSLFQSADPYLTLSGASSSPSPAYGYNDWIEGPIVYMELLY